MAGENQFGAEQLGMGLSAVQAGLSAFQTVYGTIKATRLSKQLRAYHTPEEVYKNLNAAAMMAQQGFDPATLGYLTSQTQKQTAGALDVASRLGGDPNSLSAILGQQTNNLMKIGAENHNLNMANFQRYLSAMDNVAKNKEAEQISAQNLIKDQIKAATGEKAAGVQNFQNAGNTLMSILAAQKQMELFNPRALPSFATSSTLPSTGYGSAGQVLDNNDYQ
jgi:hypothetical protein